MLSQSPSALYDVKKNGAQEALFFETSKGDINTMRARLGLKSWPISTDSASWFRSDFFKVLIYVPHSFLHLIINTYHIWTKAFLDCWPLSDISSLIESAVYYSHITIRKAVKEFESRSNISHNQTHRLDAMRFRIQCSSVGPQNLVGDNNLIVQYCFLQDSSLDPSRPYGWERIVGLRRILLQRRFPSHDLGTWVQVTRKRCHLFSATKEPPMLLHGTPDLFDVEWHTRRSGTISLSALCR